LFKNTAKQSCCASVMRTKKEVTDVKTVLSGRVSLLTSHFNGLGFQKVMTNPANMSKPHKIKIPALFKQGNLDFFLLLFQ